MNFSRLGRHLLALPGAVRRAFPPAAMAAIEQAIARSETQHRGEVRFAVEAALDASSLLAGESARERALEVFAQLGVWDTAENNGVLVYLLLADRDVEIVADRGINALAGHAQWEAICRTMEAALRRGEFEQAVLGAIEAITQLLARHFPPRAGAERNELADRPTILR
jgi:uncharacterized membrane protein